MHVDTALVRDTEKFTGEKEAVGDHHRHINFLCRNLSLHPCVQDLRLDYREAEGECLLLDSTNAGSQSSARRAIGLGHDKANRVARLVQLDKRGNCKFRSAEKDQPQALTPAQSPSRISL